MKDKVNSNSLYSFALGSAIQENQTFISAILENKINRYGYSILLINGNSILTQK